LLSALSLQAYHNKAYLYEGINLFRRTLFSVLEAFVPPEQVEWRASSYVFLCLLIFLVHLLLRPFRDPIDNQLETGSLLVLLVISIVLTGEDKTSQHPAGISVLLSIMVIVPAVLFAISIVVRRLKWFQQKFHRGSMVVQVGAKAMPFQDMENGAPNNNNNSSSAVTFNNTSQHISEVEFGAVEPLKGQATFQQPLPIV
jgi:hypothetical protein